MSTDFPTDPREALEASLTALLLEELPADQSAFLRDAIARDPELARRYERLKQTIDLVRITAKTPVEEVPNPSPVLKLSQQRREELLQHFKTVAPREFAQKRRPKIPWLVPLSIAALLIAVCSLFLVQAPPDSEHMGTLRLGSEEALRERSLTLLPKSKQNAAGKKLDNSEMVQLSRRADNFAPSSAAGWKTGIVLPPTAESTPAQKPATAPELNAPAPTYDTFAFYQNPAGLPIEPTPGLPMTATSGGGGLGGGGGPAATFLNGIPDAAAAGQALNRRYGLEAGRALNGAAETERLAKNEIAVAIDPSTGLPVQITNALPTAGPAMHTDEAEQQVPTSSAAPGPLSISVPIAGIGDVPASMLSTDTLKGVEGLRDEARLDLRHSEKIRESMFAKRAEAQSSVTTSDLQAKAQSLKDGLAERDKEVKDAKSQAGRKLNETQLAQLEVKNSAGYDNDSPLAKSPVASPVPQPEVLTRENSFSTFSLNVSDVSFKLAAASLEKGTIPDPASIRVEEFINAFDYRDPEPGPGVPIGFTWERSQYPFAQNRDLLRFSLKTAAQGRQAGRPLNLVLLLDNSGSMERADRVRIIQEALRVLAAQLQAQDTFSVVTFARTARLWVDGIPGNQAGNVAEQISGLSPQGGTNLEEAMNLAYQTALRHYLPNGVNRVVLLTDGAANLGNVDPETLKQKVETNRKQGIALDCFGIGWEGYNDDLLEVLTRNGDGRYGFINTPEEAAGSFANQLAGALRVAAADVKVQVEFNPSRVTTYRQIGYARHQLTKEQFRDNTVDAAEIGAAESGNALYVIEVNPSGEGPIATVRVRYKVPGTAEFHEHEWPVPYTGKASSLELASPALRLGASASAFGEWLSTSPYAAEVKPDALLGYLNGIPEIYGADTRPKTLEWMIRQAKSITGK